MRKNIPLILLLSTVLVLSGCGLKKSEQVVAVEQKITNIGIVTLASEQTIIDARNAYNALTDEEKSQVENYTILQEAEIAYDALGIKLTPDNYEKYMTVTAKKFLTGESGWGIVMGTGKTIGSPVYTGIDLELTVSGKSQNYDYQNVIVTIKVTGDYLQDSQELVKARNHNQMTNEEYVVANDILIDATLSVVADIVGNGKDEYSITLPAGYWLHESLLTIGYEVVDVSGFLVSPK